MLPLAKPRLIHFYVWWHKDKPIYVGQAADVEKRAKQHPCRKGLFGKFLRAHAKECSVEMLDSHVTDRPMGSLSVSIENAFIDYYGTMAPRGFNLRRADECRPDMHASAAAAAAKWAKDNPRAAAENARTLDAWRLAHPAEVKLACSRAGSAGIRKMSPEDRARGGRIGGMSTPHDVKVRIGKRVHEMYPGMASERMRRTHQMHPEMAVDTGRRVGRWSVETGHLARVRIAGLRVANHARWHVRRGIRNPECKLCIETS